MNDLTSASASEQAPESHGDYVPSHEEFDKQRVAWRRSLAEDDELRSKAVALQLDADVHRFTYTWEWAGVPIIRLPDDVMVAQELFWAYQPERVVETGVARGGSVLLYASLMRMFGGPPRVLGIDHKLYPHTTELMTEHPQSAGVELVEADSTSDHSRDAVAAFLAGAKRAVLVLDSNHTETHVLAELSTLAPLLPRGSYVLVADTLIEEYPAGHYSDRPWDRGDNPLTAVNRFLQENADFVRSDEWGRRALISEFRDGIIRRVV